MSDQRPVARASQHEQVAALIPWYVNETLGDADRSKLEEHLLACTRCREDLALEQRIRERMSVDGPLELMPAASLNRLRGMLDGESVQPRHEALIEPSGRRFRHWRWLTAASFAVAMAVAGLVAGHWLLRPGGRSGPDFYTVTDSVPHPRAEVVRAVFAPTITLVELQALLDEAQLRIISGPTEAGVYSLAAKSTLPVSTSLALLRRHSTVRFAESTVPSSAEPVAKSGSPP
jgi:anti-sigma factor RsiW